MWGLHLQNLPLHAEGFVPNDREYHMLSYRVLNLANVLAILLAAVQWVYSPGSASYSPTMHI